MEQHNGSLKKKTYFFSMLWLVMKSTITHNTVIIIHECSGMLGWGGDGELAVDAVSSASVGLIIGDGHQINKNSCEKQLWVGWWW